MTQNVLEFCRNFGSEFSSPDELCHFEPQDTKHDKV